MHCNFTVKLPVLSPLRNMIEAALEHIFGTYIAKECNDQDVQMPFTVKFLECKNGDMIQFSIGSWQ